MVLIWEDMLTIKLNHLVTLCKPASLVLSALFETILTTQRKGPVTEAQDNIHAAGELLHLIWTSARSRVPDFPESDLISKMTQEASTMT